ncbi:MAG: response regulator transcription factor [Chloroflexi bacterium]|nr:response regulator transcription factor [Chloroflexota bacterium]
MDSKRVLIVEDDRTLLDVLNYNLAKEGYDVLMATSGSQALEVSSANNPDLIILDLMLPEMSGLEVCRILRKKMTVPILMLTARADEIDKVAGLDLGADDYMTKPFSMRELLARVRALLRRTEMATPKAMREETLLRVANLEIDLARRRVTTGEVELILTAREFDLLAFLAKNEGLVFSREQLLEKVWGYDYAGDTRTVDVHIRWLRQKIENDPAKPRHLVTLRGVGYKLEG